MKNKICFGMLMSVLFTLEVILLRPAEAVFGKGVPALDFDVTGGITEAHLYAHISYWKQMSSTLNDILEDSKKTHADERARLRSTIVEQSMISREKLLAALTAVAARTVELEALQGQLRQRDVALAERTAEVVARQAALGAETQEKDRVAALLGQARQDLGDRDQEIQRLSVAFTAKEADVMARQDEVRQLGTQLAAMQADLAQSAQKLAALSKKEEAANKENAGLRASVATQTRDLTVLHDRNRDLGLENQAVRADRDAIKQRAEDLAQEVLKMSAVSQQLMGSQQALDKAQREVAQLGGVLGTLTVDNDRLRQEVVTLTADIDQRNTTILQQKDEIARIEKEKTALAANHQRDLQAKLAENDTLRRDQLAEITRLTGAHQTTVLALEADVQAREKDIREKAAELAHMQATLTRTTQDKDLIEHQLGASKRDLAARQRELDDLRVKQASEAADADTTARRLQQDIANAQAEVHAKEQRNQKLAAEVAAAKKATEEATRQHQSAAAAVTRLQAKFDASAAAIQQLERKTQAQEKAADVLRQQLTEKEASVSTLQAAAAKSAVAQKRLEDDKTRLEKSLAALQEELRLKEASIQQQAKDFAEREALSTQELARLTAQAKALRKTLSEKEIELATQKAETLKVQAVLEKAEADQQLAAQELVQTKKQLEKVTSELDAATRARAQLETDAEAQSAQMAQLTRKLELLAVEGSEKESRNHALVAEIAAVKQEHAKMQPVLRAAQEEVEIKARVVATLTASADLQNTKIRELEGKLSANDLAISELRAAAEKSAETQGQLKAANSDFEKQLGLQRATITKKEALLAAQRTEFEHSQAEALAQAKQTHDTAMAALRKQLDGITLDLGAQRTEVSKLQTTLKSAEDEKAHIARELAGKNKEFEALKYTLAEMTATLTQQEAALAAQLARIAELEESVCSSEARAAEKEKESATLQTKIASAREAAEEAVRRSADAQQALAAVQAELSGKAAALKALEDEVTAQREATLALRAQLETQETVISQLQSAAAVHAAELDALKAQAERTLKEQESRHASQLALMVREKDESHRTVQGLQDEMMKLYVAKLFNEIRDVAQSPFLPADGSKKLQSAKDFLLQDFGIDESYLKEVRIEQAVSGSDAFDAATEIDRLKKENADLQLLLTVGAHGISDSGLSELQQPTWLQVKDMVEWFMRRDNEKASVLLLRGLGEIGIFPRTKTLSALRELCLEEKPVEQHEREALKQEFLRENAWIPAKIRELLAKDPGIEGDTRLRDVIYPGEKIGPRDFITRLLDSLVDQLARHRESYPDSVSANGEPPINGHDLLAITGTFSDINQFLGGALFAAPNGMDDSFGGTPSPVRIIRPIDSQNVSLVGVPHMVPHIILPGSSAGSAGSLVQVRTAIDSTAGSPAATNLQAADQRVAASAGSLASSHSLILPRVLVGVDSTVASAAGSPKEVTVPAHSSVGTPWSLSSAASNAVLGSADSSPALLRPTIRLPVDSTAGSPVVATRDKENSPAAAYPNLKVGTSQMSAGSPVRSGRSLVAPLSPRRTLNPPSGEHLANLQVHSLTSTQ